MLLKSTVMVGMRAALTALASCAVMSAHAYTTGPGQFDDGHDFHFDQASTILRNDGHRNYANFTTSNLWIMKRASYRCDHYADFMGIPWAASNHYMTPWGWGLPGCISAGDLANSCMSNAINEWRAGRRANAVVYLGIVCHLVQDSTVPHHANLEPFLGHSNYERKFDNFTFSIPNQLVANGGGYYFFYPRSSPWYMVSSGATASRNYLPWVDGRNGWWWRNDSPKYVAKRMAPVAQRLTAGAIYYFLKKVNYPDF